MSSNGPVIVFSGAFEIVRDEPISSSKALNSREKE